MRELRYTLISDGSSDRTLLEIIKWLFDDLYPTLSVNGQYCDFKEFPNPPKQKEVANRVERAKLITPFDICFYHRDAEKFSVEHRVSEIRGTLTDGQNNVVVCVIPVKMMESWLLIDTQAIKKAAGNRNYKVSLDMPKLNKLESHQRPKDTLHNLLRQATNKTGRGLKNFNVDRSVHLVAEYIEDYSPLRQLAAFRAFEADMKGTVDRFLSTSQLP